MFFIIICSCDKTISDNGSTTVQDVHEQINVVVMNSCVILFYGTVFDLGPQVKVRFGITNGFYKAKFTFLMYLNGNKMFIT